MRQERATMSELSSTATGELCKYRVYSAVTIPTQPPPSTSYRAPEISHLPRPIDRPATSRESLPSPVTNTPGSPLHLSPTYVPENALMLPQYTAMANPMFTWGEYDSASYTNTLNAVYAEAVHCREDELIQSSLWKSRGVICVGACTPF